jgi:mannose-6-phosphate isomerase class I
VPAGTGESWECAAIDAATSSIIVSGVDRGKRLSDVMALPLLVKLIDTDDDLSIQVHPNGKEEAWLILEAEPGARILHGFADDNTTAADVREAAARGTTAALLRSVFVAAGDVVHIPAGVVHAAGKGMLLLEVQQPLDVTYRLDDFGRVDAKTGQRRTLHVEEAIAVMRTGPQPALRAAGTGSHLVVGAHVHMARSDKGSALPVPRDTDVVLFVERGTVTVTGGGAVLASLVRGQTILVPRACLDVAWTGGTSDASIVAMWTQP